MKKFLLCILSILFIHFSLSAQNPNALKVQKSGKGTKTIVLIPGFSCAGDVWKETVENLGSRYTCYALTMPGFAGNAPENQPDFKDWVKSIASFIKQEKLARPMIIGHSIGGIMALWLAADYPELVSSVIVVDALPCLSAVYNPAFKAKDTIDCIAMATRFAMMSDKDLYKMQQQNIAGLMTDTIHREEAIQWSMHSDRKTLGTIYCQFTNIDLREKIASIKCPVLVLLESNFENIKTVVEGQYQKLSTAKLEYAKKGLHFIMYDDKDWYLGRVNEFSK